MTEINVDGDGENTRAGLMALIVTVIDLLVDALSREAVRRMEGGRLTDEEIERLGTQLARLEAELDRLAEDEGIEEEVSRLRKDLDGIVNDALQRIDEREGERYAPIGGEGP